MLLNSLNIINFIQNRSDMKSFVIYIHNNRVMHKMINKSARLYTFEEERNKIIF